MNELADVPASMFALINFPVLGNRHQVDDCDCTGCTRL